MEKVNKFELKQEVWLIHDNKIVKGHVIEMYLNYNEGKYYKNIDHFGNEVLYTLYGYEKAITKISENRLFSSKEELIKSLQ